MPSGSRTAWVAPNQVEVFDGLPWFVADMRPQGFIGRQFPVRIAQLGLPPSITDWNASHVLQALSAAGSDEPGDLVLGRAALEQYLLQAMPQPISTRNKAKLFSASVQFSLAPCYDMLPMRFAPTAQGIRPLQIPKIVPQADLLGVWSQALVLAQEFWGRVIADSSVSADFVQIAHAAKLQVLSL